MFQRGTLCRSETVASTVVVLAILVGLIAFFNRDVFNDPNAQVSAAGEIEGHKFILYFVR